MPVHFILICSHNNEFLFVSTCGFIGSVVSMPQNDGKDNKNDAKDAGNGAGKDGKDAGKNGTDGKDIKAGQGDQKVITANENIQQGSCGMPANFAGEAPIAALGTKCGKAITVKGPDGTVKAKVVSACGKRCVPGTIELNEKAAKQINKAPPGRDGTF